MIGYFLILSIFVILFIPPVFADDESVQDETQEGYTYEMYPGSLRFDTKLDDLSCDGITPNPKVKTGRSLNIDGMDDYFFIILGKTDSGNYHYLQIQLPDNEGKENRESYLLDFKKQDEVVWGGLYQDYSQLAVYMETDKEAKKINSDNSKRFLIGQSKKVTSSSFSFGPGDYDMHAILFQSDRSNWIRGEVCAISLNWPISVDDVGYITTSEPQTQVGLIFPLRTNPEALAETEKIIEQANQENKVSEPSNENEFPTVYQIPDIEVSADSSILSLDKWNLGEVYWLEASYPASGTGVVRVIDPDMNLDPKAVDNFDVYVWSDSDFVGTAPTVSETGAATGIFEGTVFFTTTDDSSGHRLRVGNGDTIYSKYEDSTLPEPYTTADEIDIVGTSMIQKIPPPKQQIKNNIEPTDISCNTGLVLIFKASDNSPACVKPSTVQKLVERGWTNH